MFNISKKKFICVLIFFIFQMSFIPLKMVGSTERSKRLQLGEVLELDDLHDELYNSEIDTFPVFIGLDLCGTVLDSKKSDISAINATIKKFKGPEFSWSDIRPLKNPNLSMKENFANFFGSDFEKEAYEDYISNLLSSVAETKIFNGVFKFLNFCRINKIHTAFITNRDKDYVEAIRSKHPEGTKLLSMVDCVLTADEAACTKPNPSILDKTFSKLGLNRSAILPKKIFFIGDSLADARLTRNTTINGSFVLMTESTSDFNLETLESLSTDDRSYIFKNYTTLLDALISVKKNKKYEFCYFCAPWGW